MPRPSRHSPGRPKLPSDGPLLSIDDVAAYLRLSRVAVRKLIDGRVDGDDCELGDLLRRLIVRISPRRRYVQREAFLAWLFAKAGAVTTRGGADPS